jgi:apolipoprotein D and lipocalin family protein
MALADIMICITGIMDFSRSVFARIRKSHGYLILCLCLFLIMSSCSQMNKEPIKSLETVSHVDLSRYIGLWYEIARYTHRFQEGCVGSRATYSLRDDGKITVVNECFDGSFSGKLRSVQGKAWVVDKQSNAKLKVSFF